MSRGKVLVVEASKALRLALTLHLRANGYTVVTAEDGYTAVRMARETLPDVILLDSSLPAGNGFTVLERLQGLAPVAHIPVIMLLSGHELPTIKRQALRAGASAVFPKPVDPYRLLEVVEDTLSSTAITEVA